MAANDFTPSTRPVTEEEYYRGEQAYAEYLKNGATEIVCPRCGSPFIFEDYGSGYVIRCESGCFKVSARGI